MEIIEASCINNMLEKSFLLLLYLKVCKLLLSMAWLVGVFFAFQENERQKNLFTRSNLSFKYEDF